MGRIDQGVSTHVVLLFCIALIGCDGDATKTKIARGEIERIPISASAVTVGFQSGKLRNSERLQRFEITPLPVTASQYAACVKAKGCPATAVTQDSTTSTENDPDSADTSPDSNEQEVVAEVARGVSVDGAKAFCSWVGGTLPTLPQWLLAARGVAPQRFAWGEHLATCKEHPNGVNLREDAAEGERDRRIARSRAAASYAPCGSSVSSRFAVDKHPASTSASGLKDTLLASAELLAKFPTSIFGSCRGTDGFCEVFGSVPGAIDFVREPDASTSTSTLKSSDSPRFAFRCVWAEGGDQ